MVSQWTTTLNEWDSDYTSNHAQALNAFIKGIQGEKNKDSLSFAFFFFKLRKKDCQGEEWTSYRETESEAFKDIIYIPQRNQLRITVRITEDLGRFYIFFSKV